jgi:CRISPR-associated protein Csx3
MKGLPKSQIEFSVLPAVVVGGPPHSGKSVLAYSLTQRLRAKNVPHYLLRAYPPDYEGDWFLGVEPDTVRHLRLKGSRSEDWLPLLKRDVSRRHLPLIVDMGGLPTPEQETILDNCTHAVLLTPDEKARQEWDTRLGRHGLVLLADLHSHLAGQNQLAQKDPVLRGTLAGLERGRQAEGAAFAALAARLSELFTAASVDLRRQHLESAPTELVVDIEQMARQKGWNPTELQPQFLPEVLDFLPAQKPLALYGRGPNWIYAAVAAHASPAPFFLFDIRLGWVKAPTILTGGPSPEGTLTVQEQTLSSGLLLEFFLPDTYLDITKVSVCRLPSRSAERVILSGKLPLWLWAALVRDCKAAEIAVMQPQVEGAIIVRSNNPEVKVGTVIPMPQGPGIPAVSAKPT